VNIEFSGINSENLPKTIKNFTRNSMTQGKIGKKHTQNGWPKDLTSFGRILWKEKTKTPFF